MPYIRILPQNLVNQIAAGEVVERPASVLKELIENAIDSGANNIDVTINNGGKTLISVSDDGSGIVKDELHLALTAHATSKLEHDKIDEINNLGFRGEALASIASVSKILIKSKHKNSSVGYEIYNENSTLSSIKPTAIGIGTEVQVRDLFFSTPGRLKFLRNDNIETTFCYKIFKRLSLSNPYISFKLYNNSKLVFNYLTKQTELNEDVYKNRVEQIIGIDFISHSVFLDTNNSMMNVTGFLSIPTFTKNITDDQYVVINGRSIKDKFLTSVVKSAYINFINNNQQPLYAIFINIKPPEIDVNVNPTKSEVRFRDPSFIRHIIYSSVKEALRNTSNQQSNSNIANKIFGTNLRDNIQEPLKKLAFLEDKQALGFDFLQTVLIKSDNLENNSTELQHANTEALGYAKIQLNKNWVISMNTEDIIIIDQHAAHERILFEQLKEQFYNNKILIQDLLFPVLLNFDPQDTIILLENKEILQQFGIKFTEKDNNIIILSMPSILKSNNILSFVKDIIDTLKQENLENNITDVLKNKINKTLITMACHRSIRSGKTLSVTEMNELLRTMEATQSYAQCPHGRPTFIKIPINKIESLFGR